LDVGERRLGRNYLPNFEGQLMRPTLIVHNATILADPAQPLARRDKALAVFYDRIAAVGDDAGIRALAGPATEVVNAGGRLLLPGFVDSHIHLYDLARRRHQVRLEGTGSLEEVLERVAARVAAAPAGAWVLGGGWNQYAWGHTEMPVRHALDRVAPNHPVALSRMDGHTIWLNSAALQQCEIGAQTRAPEGGAIDLGPDGLPNGILREDAIQLVFDRTETPGEDVVAEELAETIRDLHALGLTGVHDQRVRAEGPLMWRLLQRLHREGRLTLRTTTNISPEQLPHAIAAGLQSGLGDDWLRIGWLKAFADGTLGSRTALMLEPFEGERGNRGMAVHSAEEIYEWAHQAAMAGIATSVHAIGDRANRQVLDLYEQLRHSYGPALRHKIEHVQVIHPSDLPRLAQLGVAASMQTVHIADDWQPADRFWGERSRYAYAVRSLLDHGTILALGSDAPVASANPMLGLFTAVARQDLREQPAGGWYPEERLSIHEALAAYTVGPAQVAGSADRLGRLLPGYLADFIVLDRDVTAVEPAAIKDTKVLLTVAGGRVVHRDL
ncbi:MAG TPA: amidohydrolase, partial [Ardenticatenaceae bacterium]|nr:amidohydrolase [Ardenticatenaceae bacterium]